MQWWVSQRYTSHAERLTPSVPDPKQRASRDLHISRNTCCLTHSWCASAAENPRPSFGVGVDVRHLESPSDS